MSLLFSKPYFGPPATPYWGAPNSNANFCEEDYIVTSYIAEFVNTVTNISYVIYGAHGLSRLRGKPDGPLSFLGFPYWGLIGVGVLSAYFHATLKYHSQMCDDTSMLVATGFVLNRAFTFDVAPTSRRNRSLGLLAILTAVTIYHCVADEILVHVVTFGIMIVLVGIRTKQLVHTRITDLDEKKRVKKLVNFGAANAGIGYLLWNIDQHLCPMLLSFRHKVGLPFGIFLELHGWWHILTAIGAYTFMILVEHLTTDKTDRAEDFLWPLKGSLDVPKDQEKKN
ncbi:alkaline phytoceramidase [Lophium mytilinum]|uniref:Alkaline phytoceramidase n=1 Tax=Lophium mytilinum TaxID=390894 RepID=A0A6A6QUI4_9PEZI|nr:alkaline phytoceramidase [Lophium mytilinum]